MFKGRPCTGLEFYTLLNQSEEFTSALGKVTLLSGELEAEIILLLKRNEIDGFDSKATLGKLIGIAHKNNLFTNNEKNAFERTSKQRNYITHNIYALLTDQIDETRLDRKNLLDSDVDLYIEKIWLLKENIIGLIDFIKKKNYQQVPRS